MVNKTLLWTLAGVGAILIIIGLDLNFGITGYGYVASQLTAEQAFSRHKTIWDWLELLIIPAVLAGGAIYFNRSERQNERIIADQRLQEERRIATDRAEAVVLRTYLEKMSELLIDKELRKSDVDSEKRVIARSLTLTTLKQINGERKGTLIRFLYESGLLNGNLSVINLAGADLSEPITTSAKPQYRKDWVTKTRQFFSISPPPAKKRRPIYGVNLARSYLQGANLSETDLAGVNLEDADLTGANLSDANLSKAYLVGAKLSNANLNKSILYEANLHSVEYNNQTIWPTGFTPPPDAVNVDEKASTSEST